MISSLDLFVIQEKIRRAIRLSSSQEHFVTKSADERGVPSRRKFEGLREYPDSQIDRIRASRDNPPVHRY